MTISLISAILVISLFGLGLYYIITSEKKRQAKKLQLLQNLGFYPLDQPDNNLIEKIKSLYERRPNLKKEIEKIHFRKEGQFQIYLYEVWDRTGKENDLDDAWGMAIYSEYLNLPRFTLFPKVNMTGKMAALANFVIERLVPNDAEIVDFKQYDSFSRRYIVGGNDQENIRKVFSEKVVNRFSDTEYWQVEADGHLFTFSKIEFRRNQKHDEFQLLNSRLQDIRYLFKLFSEKSTVQTE